MAGLLPKPLWVLLPGFDGSGALFSPLLKTIPPDTEVRVITYPPDQALDYAGLRLSVEKELPRVPYLLIAESFAGPLALQLAGKGDPMLRGVVLCASFVANPRPLLSAFIGERVARLMGGRRPPRWLLRYLLLGQQQDTDLELATVAAVQRLTRETAAARWMALRDVDVSLLLEHCRVPLRVLHATQDRLLGDRALRVMRTIREDLDIVSIDAPHFLLQTAPKEVLASIGEFARRL